MKVARILFCLAVVALAAALVHRPPQGVETDLYSLADSRQGGALKAIAEGLATSGRVLLAGEDLEALTAKAREIRAAFDQPPMVDSKETLAYLDSHKAGLLAPETRAQLLAGKFADVAQAAAARLFGLVPPLFSVKGDPFLLATDYAMALESNLAAGWSLESGFPVCTRDDVTYLLLTLDLARVEAVRLVAFLDDCARRNAEPAPPIRIWCGGPPFHAARSTVSSKREINFLSGLSLSLVVLFGWLLFRSFRFIPHLLLAEAVGFAAAAGALFAVFPRPHVLTFVFGTSLIGLSVDYVYHARKAGGARAILRPLTLSLATTVACFAPLFFADVVVLREMALFTVAGLVAVYGFVVAWPGGAGARTDVTPAAAPPRAALRGLKLACGVALLVVVPLGILRLKVVEDPAAFYRPAADLAAGEKKLFEVSPLRAQRFVFVEGSTLQAALEREEALGVKGLSAIIPSLRRQRENADLIARLIKDQGRAYTAETGLKMPQGETGGFLDPEALPEGPLRAMVRSMRVAGGLVAPAPAVVPPGVPVIEPRAALADLFHRFTVATWKLLAASFGVFLVMLVLFFRRAFFRFTAPVLLALATTAAALGFLGVPITFFTLLCFFVLMGLGIDYSIFHRSSPRPETRRVVFYAFLTSFAGLGLLAVTSFPVTRAMGVTFAIGLAAMYFFSRLPVGGRPKEAPSLPCEPWHAQREQSAGRWRLQAMWLAYRFCGKSALKILCVPVMAFIYPFARPAKAALRAFAAVCGRPVSSWSIFCHLLGFAWSLADKFDACTLKKNLPKMAVRDDASARAFRERIAAKKGAFLISTHLGTIEVLPALAARSGPSADPNAQTISPPLVHAFQQMGHDAVFTEFFMRHFDTRAFALHAVEAIGVETAVEMQSAIARGDLVLMAGDRVSAGSKKTLRHDFLGRSCAWPKGVFTFAKLMEAPIFFVTCVRTGWNAYEVHLKQFEQSNTASSLLAEYVAFLEAEVRAHPEQWYQFYDFFGCGEEKRNV